MTGKIAASGNIMSLYDKDGVTSAMSSCGLMALFFNCTSLTTPPELPATSFAADCYSNLFRGCSSLEYVKTAMTSEQLASGTYTSNWLANVASTGTYESTDPDFDTSIARGVNTVPAGWNIVKPGPPENPFRKFFIDGKEVSELFVDGHEVKLADAPMALKGLAFKAKQDGSTVALTKIGAPVDVSLEYAVNSNEDEDF